MNEPENLTSELMERLWKQCMLDADPPDYIICTRRTLLRVRNARRNPLKRPGSRMVPLTEEQAVELGIAHLRRPCGFWRNYVGEYDRRRVKRARRAALRHENI